jgi:uncharacterized RDD family membrane protein YckC
LQAVPLPKGHKARLDKPAVAPEQPQDVIRRRTRTPEDRKDAMTLSHPRPASLTKRVVAGVIDYLLMTTLLWMPILLVAFGDIDTEIEFTRSGIGAYFLPIRLLILWLFPYCLRDSFRGRGLGKWLLGIRVADAADMTSVPSMKQLLLRNVTIWLSPLGLASASLHPDKMRFGDRLAGTVVVEDVHDAMSSALRRRLFKGVVFVGLAGCCIASAAFGFSNYVRNSKVHEVALRFLGSYGPLQQVVPGFAADNVSLLVANCMATEKGAAAFLMYGSRKKDRNVRVDILMDRGLGDNSTWHVREASGLVKLDAGREGKTRVFAFLLGKDFHRFLTEDEVTKIFREKRAPMEVIPELKSADNETTPDAAPGKSATEPPAGSTTVPTPKAPAR